MDDSGYKGFNYPLKGIVTSLDDPANLNRIQVYIPNYHGKRDSSREGPEGSYPWAQVNTLIQQIEETTNNGGVDSGDESSSGGFFSGITNWLSGVVQKVKRIFVNDEGKGFENIAPPEVEDVVWLIFEGGDIRCPVYFGTAAVPKNAKDKVIVDTGSVGSFGDTFYSADGSSGSTYQLAGGSLVDMICTVIYCNGGSKNYGKIVSGGSGVSMSLGYIDALASNGDAAKLLQSIYSKDKSTYNSICEANFNGFIDPNKNWSNQTLPANNRLTKAVKKLLESDAGKSAQDEKAYSNISTYTSVASSMGVTDPTAVIFFCDMYKKVGSSVKTGVKSLPSKSLDDLYEYSKSLGGYDGSSAYSLIQKFISQGKFVKTTTSTLSSGSSTGISLKWPVPSSTLVITPFSSSHRGIDIRASQSAPVVAANSGTYSTVSTNYVYGKYITITGSDGITTEYRHLNSFKANAKQGNSVKVGAQIGTVGMTGDATGPHLHFEVRKNGISQDPQSCTYGNNSTSLSTGNSSLDETGIWNALKSLGYNNYAVAALMGNMQAESNLRSNNVQDTSGWDDNQYTNAVDSGTYTRFGTDNIGYGLCQWTDPSRKPGLLSFAKSKNVSISNASMQILYLQQELTTKYTSVYNVLKNATSIEYASDCVLRDFESPYQYWKQYSYRQGLCKQIYDRHAR